MLARRLTPMVLAVMIAAELVVVSVAVLACLPFKFLLSWLKKLTKSLNTACLISSRYAPRSSTKLKIVGHKLKARRPTPPEFKGRTI
jgi:hypothetical protein